MRKRAGAASSSRCHARVPTGRRQHRRRIERCSSGRLRRWRSSYRAAEPERPGNRMIMKYMTSGPVRLTLMCVVAALVATFGCGSPDALQAERRAAAAASEIQAAGAIPPAENQTEAARPRIVALGDSLTAGLGLPRNQAYPALLQQRVTAEGF